VSECLKLIPGCENVSNDDIREWINQNEEQQLTDNDTVDLVNHAGDDLEDDNEGPEKADQMKMSHSEGLNSIETALAYVEQQREVTATDVLLLRRWHDLAAKKRKVAQKQITITNFLKNTLFHLQIYIMLNTIFVCEIFI
jgi:hypothetical protein